MIRNYHIGCSGYYYPYWKNRFYPEGLQPKNWLHYYSTVFNTAELNGTFYRTPKLADLQKYAAVTESGFTFAVKVSRFITHIARLKNSTQQIAEFTGLIREGLGEKLSCFLFQMPPTFQYTPENLALILDNVPHSAEHVVELRHASWWNEEVKDAFTRAGITFCNVDFPGLDTPLISTTDLFYFRFHGNPVLFKSAYTEEQLATFYNNIPPAREYRIYFNNTYYEAGYTNALELMKILAASKM
jgi:uncharacterized protein YecE (DUF72 family)